MVIMDNLERTIANNNNNNNDTYMKCTIYKKNNNWSRFLKFDTVNMRVEMTYELYPRAVVNQHVLHVNRSTVFVALDRLDVDEHSFLPI